MTEQATVKRSRRRGPNLGTVIAEAEKRGLQMTGATVKPGGIIELNFSREMQPAPVIPELDPPEAA